MVHGIMSSAPKHGSVRQSNKLNGSLPLALDLIGM